MSSAAQFYKAARPEPPRVIGLQLRPYSLGHHLTLHAYDSSFVNGAGALFSDMILGVLICSLTWKEWEVWKRSWKLAVFLKVWGWRMGKFDVKAEAEKFTAYLAEGSECPEVAVPSKGRALSAAWESRLKLFLVKELRLTVDEAMDYPLALAWQEYCAHGEQEGTLTLLSEGDKQSLEWLKSDEYKRMVAEAEAEGRKETAEMKAKAEAQKKGAN